MHQASSRELVIDAAKNRKIDGDHIWAMTALLKQFTRSVKGRIYPKSAQQQLTDFFETTV